MSTAPEKKPKSLFQTDVAKYKKKDIVNAKKWFRDNIAALASGKDRATIKDLRLRTAHPSTVIGSMCYYRYDPKWKDILPFYDTFPLVIILEEYKDGYLGLNLHYLPPSFRAKFLGVLFDTLNNTKFDKTTKLKVTYGILKSITKYKFFSPCIKRYLFSHMKSSLQVVRPTMWHRAIMLPMAQFKKSSAATVWADSKNKWK